MILSAVVVCIKAPEKELSPDGAPRSTQQRYFVVLKREATQAWEP
jgi:hypothetical protein